MNQPSPPLSRSEKIADGAIHVLGVCGAIAGTFLLARWTIGSLDAGPAFAFGVYGLTLVLTFGASAIYNMSPEGRLRPILRRIDHAAIYLKIAGTYTPLVVMIGTPLSYFILAIVWGLAVFGLIRKLFFWQTPGKLGTVLYLIMGWLSVFIIWDLSLIAPAKTIWLIVIGGLIYTLGVGFYSWKTLKYSKAIWHGFVVAASLCFYVAIVLGLRATLL